MGTNSLDRDGGNFAFLRIASTVSDGDVDEFVARWLPGAPPGDRRADYLVPHATADQGGVSQQLTGRFHSAAVDGLGKISLGVTPLIPPAFADYSPRAAAYNQDALTIALPDCSQPPWLVAGVWCIRKLV